MSILLEVEKAKSPRAVAFVDETFLVEGRGYRVSIVYEGERFHRPTGTWPYNGRIGEILPWFWGPTLKDAQAACVQHNARMGISEEEAFIIVARSMGRRLGGGR